MRCEYCNGFITVKQSEQWITLLCKCKCMKILPTGHIKVIPYEIYKKQKEV